MHCFSYFLWTLVLSSLNLTTATPVNQYKLTFSGSPWTNKTLVYRFGEGLALNDYWRIYLAMKDMFDKTCVRFRLAENFTEPQVIIERKESGCGSYFGCLGKPQRLNLGSEYCMKQDNIQHELLHALGVVHVQKDPNRQSYVWNSYIQPNEQEHVESYSSSDSDYGSVLRKDEDDLHNKSTFNKVLIQDATQSAQNSTLSLKDELELRKMYCQSQ